MIDIWMLQVFQILFALSTLAPVVIHIVTDIWTMIVRARKQILEVPLQEENWFWLKLRALGIQLSTVFTDAVFLAIWVMLQFGLNLLIKKLNFG